MKKRISVRIKKFISCTASGPKTSTIADVDVHEEYANAFRTKSYIDFWTRVLALTNRETATCNPVQSTTAARLPSYRLFVEHLLDPDQSKVTRILALAKTRPINHSLLFDYFSETANASLLCGLLLKDIDQTRVKYRTLKKTLESLSVSPSPSPSPSPVYHLPTISAHLTEFANSFNPFVESASSPRHLLAVQASCFELIKRLESTRDQTRAKYRLANSIRRGSSILLLVLTASVTVIVASHAFAMVMAAPSLIAASLELASTRRLDKASAQLDAAAKGTYILNRDLDTISRLVTRLNDELEHMRAMVRFWLERGEDRLHAIVELARQLQKNDSSFIQQLDDLEEHLYLCFMTINRARDLVIREIMDPSQPNLSK